MLEVDDNAYVASRLSQEETERLAARDITVHRVDRSRLHHEEYVRWLLAGIQRQYGSPGPSLHNSATTAGVAWSWPPAPTVPLATLFHGGDAKVGMADERFRERFERLIRLPGSYLGGVSENIVADLVAFGVPVEQTFLQHHGIDLGPFEVPNRSSHEPGLRILMAGRFLPFKDHETALRGFALHRARFPDSRLALYGEGPLEEATRRLAAALEINDAIEFGGLVPVPI